MASAAANGKVEPCFDLPVTLNRGSDTPVEDGAKHE